jgi:hypothetical protein
LIVSNSNYVSATNDSEAVWKELHVDMGFESIEVPGDWGMAKISYGDRLAVRFQSNNRNISAQIKPKH